MTRHARLLLSSLALGAALLIGCTAGPGSSASPAPSNPATTPGPSVNPTPAPSATPPAGSEVDSAARAAALVFASDPRWARMVPLRADMIGQSTWYEAFEDGDGYTVKITAGEGDCE